MGWVRVVGVAGWESHEFLVKVELIDGSPVVVGLRIEPLSSQPIEALAIRSRRVAGLPVGELARLGSFGRVETRTFFESLEHSDDSHQLAMELPRYPLPEPSSLVRPRGGSEEFSEAVARVFRTARAAGSSGIGAVMDTWHVARQTAENWIEEARPHRGDCPPTCTKHQGVMERGLQRRPVRKDGK